MGGGPKEGTGSRSDEKLTRLGLEDYPRGTLSMESENLHCDDGITGTLTQSTDCN